MDVGNRVIRNQRVDASNPLVGSIPFLPEGLPSESIPSVNRQFVQR